MLFREVTRSDPILKRYLHRVGVVAALLALGAGGAAFAQQAAPDATTVVAAGRATPSLPLDELPPEQPVSDTVIALAGWVLANDDNEGHPFTIIDKAAAQIFVFGGDGKLRGAGPVLLGSAIGDHSLPGVGERELRDIPLKDRTTPAGRFVGGYGPAAGGERALWIDWDTAISIHPVSTGVPAEKRPERLASATPDDNRVSHGCLNVSEAFYRYVVSPTYATGGVFYILPDEWALDEAIPGFRGRRSGG